VTRWMWISLAIVAAMFVGSALASTVWLDKFPERVPIHWNIRGEADGFASRDQTFVVFYLLPTMSLGLLALAVVLPWLSPLRFKIEPFRRTYDYVFALCFGLFAWIHTFLLISAANGGSGIRFMLAGMFLFFALIGNVLGKVRKNFWMGVRTPWTLASDVVWEKTHRLAAWLFVAAGLIGFVASLCGLSPYWCFGLLMIAAFAPIFYSLALYKRLEKKGLLNLPSSEQTE